MANKNGKEERPIQYFSKTFNDAQKKYSTVEKELLAAIWGIKWFRSFLLGKPFYLVIDQKSLLWLIKGEYKNTRVHRWAIDLMEFQIEVIHREGKLNSADALSRIDTSEKEEHNKNKITCLVTTRAKTKELIHNMDKSNNDHLENDHLNMNSQKNITETGENNKVYNIIEKRGFVFNNREFDHISFFFDKMSCKIKKQPQHKMKKTLEVNNLNYGEILSFDENKSIF